MATAKELELKDGEIVCMANTVYRLDGINLGGGVRGTNTNITPILDMNNGHKVEVLNCVEDRTTVKYLEDYTPTNDRGEQMPVSFGVMLDKLKISIADMMDSLGNDKEDNKYLIRKSIRSKIFGM